MVQPANACLVNGEAKPVWRHYAERSAQFRGAHHGVQVRAPGQPVCASRTADGRRRAGPVAVWRASRKTCVGAVGWRSGSRTGRGSERRNAGGRSVRPVVPARLTQVRPWHVSVTPVENRYGARAPSRQRRRYRRGTAIGTIVTGHMPTGLTPLRRHCIAPRANATGDRSAAPRIRARHGAHPRNRDSAHLAPMRALAQCLRSIHVRPPAGDAVTGAAPNLRPVRAALDRTVSPSGSGHAGLPDPGAASAKTSAWGQPGCGIRTRERLLPGPLTRGWRGRCPTCC